MLQGFWRGQNRTARADFKRNLIGPLFDWKLYVAALVGWLVSFLVFAAFSEWSATVVWIASIAVGLVVATIHRVAFTRRYSPALIRRYMPPTY